MTVISVVYFDVVMRKWWWRTHQIIMTPLPFPINPSCTTVKETPEEYNKLTPIILPCLFFKRKTQTQILENWRVSINMKNVKNLHWRSRDRRAWSENPPILSLFGLSGLVPSALVVPSPLLGLLELAIEKTPESAWLAGESLLDASRGDSKM